MSIRRSVFKVDDYPVAPNRAPVELSVPTHIYVSKAAYPYLDDRTQT